MCRRYYEFKAAHCENKVTAAKQKATVSKLDSLFKAHSIERLGDLKQTIKMASSAAPSPPRGTCKTDLTQCTKFQRFTGTEGALLAVLELCLMHSLA